jgi:hypothetical protein
MEMGAMDSEQIGMWLDSIDDYGMGDGRYWIPTKEGFEELCRLALKGLAAPEEGFPHLDQEPLDFAAALTLLREARKELVIARAAANSWKQDLLRLKAHAPEGGASIHPAVRVALRVVLNHVEPGHENCTALLTAWLDGRLEPQNGNTK